MSSCVDLINEVYLAVAAAAAAAAATRLLSKIAVKKENLSFLLVEVYVYVHASLSLVAWS